MPNHHAIQACLITNPRGGKGELDLSQVLPVLTAHGWEVTVRQKRHGGHATELAKQAADEGFQVVVACGGDGTVGEIVDGLVGSDVAIGVIPGGTANLWAHEIGVSLDPARAALQLVAAQRRRVDVGYLTVNGKRGQHFFLMAGLGIDAAVVSTLNKDLKKRIGMLAYIPAISRVVPKRPNYRVRVDLDGVLWQGNAAQIVIGNTRRYASVTSVTADAFIDDGRLDIAILAPPHALSFGRQLLSLLVRKRPTLSTALYDRVGTVTIQSNAVIPLETDGGRVKQHKVKPTDEGVKYQFSARAQVVTVLVPREYSGPLFQHGPIEGAAPRSTAAQPSDKHRYRVLAVGVDTVQVARLRDGRVSTLILDESTRAEDRDRHTIEVADFLASLTEGMTIYAKGDRIRPGFDVLAKTLRIE